MIWNLNSNSSVDELNDTKENLHRKFEDQTLKTNITMNFIDAFNEWEASEVFRP